MKNVWPVKYSGEMNHERETSGKTILTGLSLKHGIWNTGMEYWSGIERNLIEQSISQLLFDT